MTTFSDTHCHLYMEHFGNELEQVLKNSRDQGVGNILVPGIDIKTSKAAIQLAECYENIYAAVGVHPHDADSVSTDWQVELVSLASHPKVVAIGEIGLDFYRKYSPADIQKTVFQAQLEIALQVHKPVILHERDSAEQIWEILSQYTTRFSNEFENEWGVFHSFGSTLEYAEKAIKHNLLLGISGPLTYKTAHLKRDIVAKTALEKLLLETDAPYLTPHPHRGKRNSPEYIPFIAEKIAEIKECKIEQVRDITSSNADRIFSWSSES
jgi:TatD DNase family protein